MEDGSFKGGGGREGLGRLLNWILGKNGERQSTLRRSRGNPFCVVRGTPVHGVLFAGQDGDSAKQQSSSRPRWVQPKTGSPITLRKRSNCACHLRQGAMPFKKNARSLCTALTERQGHATPLCAKAMPISVSFKSSCISRFVHSRRASILVLESIRDQQAECHPESRVNPADDSHTLPPCEEFLQSLQLQGGLRLNLAHRHPITPMSPSQFDQGTKTLSNSGVYVVSDSLSSPSDVSCPNSTVAIEPPCNAVTSLCIVFKGQYVLFGDASSSHQVSFAA